MDQPVRGEGPILAQLSQSTVGCFYLNHELALLVRRDAYFQDLTRVLHGMNTLWLLLYYAEAFAS